MDKKFWYIVNQNGGVVCTRFKTYDEAEREAKKYTKTYGDIAICEAVALVLQPVPEAEVVKLTA